MYACIVCVYDSEGAGDQKEVGAGRGTDTAKALKGSPSGEMRREVIKMGVEKWAVVFGSTRERVGGGEAKTRGRWSEWLTAREKWRSSRWRPSCGVTL